MNKNITKLLALLLALVMVVSVFAGCKKTEDDKPNDDEVQNDPVDDKTDDENKEEVELAFQVDYETNSVKAGSVTTAMGEIGGGEVGYDVYAGVAGKDYTDTAVYTYNDYMTATTNWRWSPHNWETNEDSYILDYITRGFYGFELNSDKTGWSITCEMAAELPVDVTADYVGKYGIVAGESAKAWKIALNPNACWEDGTPINADTYIYSYKELLDPLQLNRRADSLYSGDFVIVGSKEYYKQGQVSYDPIGMSVADFVAAGGKVEDLYVDMSFWGVTSADGTGYQLVTDDTMVRDPAVEDEKAAEAFVSGKYLYDTYLCDTGSYASYGADYLCTKVEYEANYSWDNVGIIKTGDYEIVMITVKPTENANYYVPYNLSSTYLVYQPLWESCKSYFDKDGNTVAADSANIASITNNYCTSKDTTISFGPYKLTYFEMDKQITMERNEKWYGYSDNKHVGQYQTDVISCQVIPEQATALMAFLKGDLDGVSLVSADMAKYGTSDYIRYTPQSYTTKLTFNTDLDALTARGTQILANPLFRQAYTLAIDRNEFAASYTSAGSAGFGMLNYMYVYDPFTGATYRDTDGAKDALCQLYGLTYGEDGEYGSLEEAYDAITGTDLEKAQALMKEAYDQCVADKLYDGTSEVKIALSVYQSDDTYVQMFNFLNDALKTACIGSGFEGKVSLEMVVDADYYETMYSGNTDMIFSTWGGAAYSPYTMLYQCYCDASDGSGNQMEYGFDTSKVNVTIEVDGLDYTDSLQNWANWANADKDTIIKSADGSKQLEAFGAYDAETRANLFSKLEYAYLAFYTTTPLYYRNSASLVSQKGDYAVQTYVDLVGFGGLAFYTYNYNDTQWADVVAKGGLNY